MSNVHLRRIRKACDALQAATDGLAALDAARSLRESADSLELEMVRAARRDGHSWSRIGAVYGLTKQGAQQRFRAALVESLAHGEVAATQHAVIKEKREMDPGTAPPAE